MSENFIKNINPSQVVEFKNLVDYQEGRVVSRTLSQGKPSNFTLLSFDKV